MALIFGFAGLRFEFKLLNKYSVVIIGNLSKKFIFMLTTLLGKWLLLELVFYIKLQKKL